MMELIEAYKLLKKIKKTVKIGAIIIASLLVIGIFTAIIKVVFSNFAGIAITTLVCFIKSIINKLH